MEINVSSILNEEPKAKEYRKECTSNLHFDLVMKQAWKIYRKTRLAEAQNWKCCFCGCDMISQPGSKNSATIEHVVPRSLGGKNNIENYAISCYSCNNSRGNKTVEVFMLELQTTKEKQKSRNEIRAEAKVRKYLKRSEKLVKECGVKSLFEDWFADLRLPHKYKNELEQQLRLKYAMG